MADPFLAEIKMFGGNFAPRGWAFCDGQLLPINQNEAVFSLLGTTYGGDGRTTFGLPDMRGRTPVHPGSGPGLTHRTLGEKGGEETITPTSATTPKPGGPGGGNRRGPGRTTGIPSGQPQTQTVANDMPQQNMQPFLGVTFIIALQGVFPSRN